MTGDRAAGLRAVDLLKRLAGAHDALQLVADFLVEPGVCNENAAAVNVVASLETILDVLYIAFHQLAAVLFRHAHDAVFHLNAGLETQQVRADRRERRAAPAGDQIFQRVEHEADIQLLTLALQLRRDVGGVHVAAPGHDGGVQHQMTDAGGEVARVHGIDVVDLLRRDAGVLVAGGHVAGDREVDHRVVFLPALGEVRDVVRHVDRRRLAQLAGGAEVRIQVFGADIDAVAPGLVAADDIERRDADVVLLDQRGREVAGAVGGNFNLQKCHL